MNIPNKQIISPFMNRKQYEIEIKDHPAQDEIKKCIGTFNLVFTVEKDMETIKLFDLIPGGVVAFKTSISSNGQILGVGRGSAIFSSVNKYLIRTVRSAYCASIIDSIVKSVKALDAIYLAGPSGNTADADEVTDDLITDKQRKCLLSLLKSNSISANSRREIESQIATMTKNEASQRIRFLMSSK